MHILPAVFTVAHTVLGHSPGNGHTHIQCLLYLYMSNGSLAFVSPVTLGQFLGKSGLIDVLRLWMLNSVTMLFLTRGICASSLRINLSLQEIVPMYG